MLVTLLAFCVAFIWGVAPVIQRVALGVLSRETILTLSAATYFVSVLIYVGFFKSGEVLEAFSNYENGKYIWLVIGLSFMTMFVGNNLYLYVLKHAHNINYANIIMALYPVITLIVAWMLLGESLNKNGSIGFVMILLGMAIMIYSTQE